MKGRVFGGFSRAGKEGVNLAGYIRAEMGLGQAARGIAAGLEAVNIPFNVVNFEVNNFARHSDSSWRNKETNNPDYDFTVLVVNPDNIGNAKLWLPKTLFSQRYVIGYWFWELPEMPDSWRSAFPLVDEVWAASRFIQNGPLKDSPVPVTRIPPVVRLVEGQPMSRRELHLPDGRFLFLSMCDASSVMERKNPLATIRAFKTAFDRNDPGVGLVLKVSAGPNPFRPDISILRKAIEGWPNIYLLEHAMSRAQINSLLSVTDCFVSLHRSEGFGLVPAEAMSLGKPVMMTRWSGNTDYMTPDNSIGVSYQLVELQRDYGPYKAGQLWAEPDVVEAAQWMKRLSGDAELASSFGERGRQTIQQELSPMVVGKLIGKRLAEIREEHR